MAIENDSSRMVELFLGERAEVIARDWTHADPMLALSASADKFISSLAGDCHGIALVAVGGYGRQELGPFSDLDVLLLHKPRLSVDRLTETLWYPIWDSRVALDYSVRTVAQAIRVAEADPRVLLGMLDARLIRGDEVLFNSLKSKIMDRFCNRLDRYRVILKSQSEHRRAESGELAFLLEPDIKESHGGLRDLVNLYHLVNAEPERLGEKLALDVARDFLLDVRNLLQQNSQRAQNRLYLQDQDLIASLLGLSDADELMFRISQTGRFISRTLEENLQVRQGRKANRTIADEWGAIPRGLFSHGGEICVDPSVLTNLDAQVIIKIAAVSVNLGLGICVDALELLSTRLPVLEVTWDPSTLSALTSLLSHGDDAIAAMERLDHYGLLGKVIPEWGRVQYLPQRNAYHTFTVDRHLIEAAVGAGRLRRLVKRPDLLIVAALLHDIGKGSGADHSIVGAELARGIATRMGFSNVDVEVIVRLVRHHLLLADTATRRDIADPTTIAFVARELVDPLTVELLRVLTEADSKATGPVAWSVWKQELIDELCESTLAYMRGDEIAKKPSFPTEFELQLMSNFDGEVKLETSGDTLWVVAADQVGLFARVAGTLAIMGLNVLEADVYSGSGVAVERFRVLAGFGREPNWSRFEAELVKSVSEPDSVSTRLSVKAKSMRHRRRVAESAKILPRVTIHANASLRATVFEVCGPDSTGLLYKLTNIFSTHGLDIVHAKVLTLGDDVVDTFYVVDSTGKMISDPDLHGAVQEDLAALVNELDASLHIG